MTMNMDELQKLSRADLQKLAKREGVKANVKSVEIIRQLITKEGGGPPSLSIRIPRMTTRSFTVKREEPGDAVSREVHPEITAKALRRIEGAVSGLLAGAGSGALSEQLSQSAQRSRATTSPQQQSPSASLARHSSEPQVSRNVRRPPTPGPSVRRMASLSRSLVGLEHVDAGVQTNGRPSPPPQPNRSEDAVPNMTMGEWRKMMRKTTKYVDTAPDFRNRVEDLFNIKTGIEQRLSKFDTEIGDLRKMRRVGERYLTEWKDSKDLWDGSNVPKAQNQRNGLFDDVPKDQFSFGGLQYPPSDEGDHYAREPVSRASSPVASGSGSRTFQAFGFQAPLNTAVSDNSAEENDGIWGTSENGFHTERATFPAGTGSSSEHQPSPTSEANAFPGKRRYEEEDAQGSQEEMPKKKRVRSRS